MGNDLYDELRHHNLLRALVQSRVIEEAVAKAPVQPNALEEAYQNFLKNNGIEDDDSMSSYLQACGLTKEDLEWQISLPLRIKAHCNANFKHKAEAHFLKRKNQLDRIIYSLIRMKDGLLARELFLRIDNGESSFADIASRYSEGAERNTNGIIGPVPLTQAHPELSERLRTCQVGELLHPFRLSELWVLVRLEKYIPASFDNAMSEHLSKELFDIWVSEEVAVKIKSPNSKAFEATAE